MRTAIVKGARIDWDPEEEAWYRGEFRLPPSDLEVALNARSL